MLSETKGKRLGSLSCRGLKPPVVRGHAAAFTYWFNVLPQLKGSFTNSLQPSMIHKFEGQPDAAKNL